mmetsp:Transcript_31809/g.71995  ORF Transcript_31809/g.71995 Transcript_31809/m.71995 type:complete len:230 (-) Transcript_31809:566-1255(-)
MAWRIPPRESRLPLRPKRVASMAYSTRSPLAPRLAAASCNLPPPLSEPGIGRRLRLRKQPSKTFPQQMPTTKRKRRLMLPPQLILLPAVQRGITTLLWRMTQILEEEMMMDLATMTPGAMTSTTLEMILGTMQLLPLRRTTWPVSIRSLTTQGSPCQLPAGPLLGAGLQIPLTRPITWLLAALRRQCNCSIDRLLPPTFRLLRIPWLDAISAQRFLFQVSPAAEASLYR